MITQEILNQLETSQHPVAKAIHKGDHFKVLLIGFKAGMLLKDHQTHLPARLYVIKGSVNYRETAFEKIISALDDHIIPINIVHQVVAIEDSLCMLIQG